MIEQKTKSNIKFVGLHGHSTSGSPFDAIGYANEHMDYAFENGMNALALTDHGNMNGYSYQFLHGQKMKEKGIDFKPIYGVEAYFHPSIESWRNLKEITAKQKKAKKKEEEASGAVLEDEAESKKKQNPLNKKNHLVLLAQNQKGLNNIFKLISESFKPENFYKQARIDYNLLSQYNEGIIVSTACLGGVFAGDMWDNYGDNEKILNAMRHTADKFKSIFDNRFYAELQWLNHADQHNLNKYIIQISKEFDIPLICTADSHYPRPELWKERSLYKKINPRFIDKEIGNPLPVTVEETGYELYPKNGDQMFADYKKYSAIHNIEYDDDLIVEAIERTHHIAHNLIENFEPNRDIVLPDFVVPEDKSADEALREKTYQCLARRGVDTSSVHYKKVVAQIEHELSIFKAQKFSKYFLTADAIIDKAKKIMLCGPGRGSGAGSLVLYTLGITQVDPAKHGLMFSRFMRKDQTDYPDVDMDFSRNDELRELLIKEWGADRVAPISTWNTLKLKTLVSDISKFYGIDFQEVKTVTKIMEREATPAVKKERGIKAGVIDPPMTYNELRRNSSTLQKFLEKYPQVEEQITVLYKQVKSNGTHAGGTIISENLSSRMPLIRSKDTTKAPWTEGQNVRHLEPLGFIKFDILGLSTLAMFEDCISLILQKRDGKIPHFSEVADFYYSILHPDILNFDDQSVYENTFHKKNFVGIFQFAEKGMQQFAFSAKPRSLTDLSAITSLWRPGPMCISENSKIVTGHYNNKRNGRVGYITKKIKDLYNQFNQSKQKNTFRIVSVDETTGDIFSNRIKNVIKSGKKPVYNIYFQNSLRKRGKKVKSSFTVEATLDHRFFTDSGWKKLSELTQNDYICVRNKGFLFKKKAHNKTIFGRKNFRDICFRNYKYHCVYCDWDKGSLDVNHIDRNRNFDNSPENLCFLCPNHHREYTEGNLSKKQILLKRKKYILPFCNKKFVFVKFHSIEFAGKKETYDIEVEGPHHNFIAGDFVVHNSSDCPDMYVRAINDPKSIKYKHPILKELIGDTYGMIVFQEQLALLANSIGKDISLEEGNMLRKVLTKKGTGKVKEVVDSLYGRFIEGAKEKNISEKIAEEIWQEMKYFAAYGFNKSHAVCYSVISYQCAWLLHYYPAEWCCAYLNQQKEANKAHAISEVQSVGFNIGSIDINESGDKWKPSKDGKTLIQPMNTVKGIGEKNMIKLIENRPYNSIDELLFDKDRKANKKTLDALIRIGSLDFLIDKRFSNRKHLWLSCAFDKPKTEKKFPEKIDEYRDTEDFTKEETLEFIQSLTGTYPFDMVVSDNVRKRIDKNDLTPISQREDEDFVWFIPVDIEEKQTRNKKSYIRVQATDFTGKRVYINCWNANLKTAKIYKNRVYASRVSDNRDHLNYNITYDSYSTNNARNCFILMG